MEGRNHHIFAGMDNTSYVSNLYSEAKDPLVLAQSLFLPPQGDPSQAQDDSVVFVILANAGILLANAGILPCSWMQFPQVPHARQSTPGERGQLARKGRKSP